MNLMTCDHCDKPAVVHEVTVKNGKRTEVHLCSEHAADAGFVVHQSVSPIEKAYQQYVISHGDTKKKRASHQTCSACEMTFAEFRKGGTLGCPICYESFEKQLGPLVERAQNGGSHHIGRTPTQSEDAIDRQLQVRHLVRELERAVEAEEYERAAELRDQLDSLESGSDDTPSPSRMDMGKEHPDSTETRAGE